MMSGNATRTAVNFLHAWSSGDRTAARALCHDDLHFRGPVASRFSADEHLDALASIGSVERIEIEHTVESGDLVVVVYDLVTASAATATPIAELNVVRDGRLAEIRAYFDTHPWRNTSDPGERMNT